MTALQQLNLQDTNPHSSTPFNVLCVDDEVNVLSALKRLLRKEKYQVFTANNGYEGLDALANNNIDIVVSDMRMPEMSGAQFLKSVASDYPDIVRILLTGYSDMEATIAAVNDGQITRYLTKPWNNDELLHAVRQGKDKLLLERENTRLFKIVEQQNSELSSLNAELEIKVEERTRQITTALNKLHSAHKLIKGNLNATIQSFYNLISLDPNLGGDDTLKISKLCHLMAIDRFSDKKTIKDTQLAGLLCQLGLIGLPDKILTHPVNELNRDDLNLYQESAERAYTALSPAIPLKDVATIIRHQFSGYSLTQTADRTENSHSLCSDILAVCRDYIYATTGRLQRSRMSSQGAIEYLTSHAGKIYNPALVYLLPKFVELIEHETLSKNERLIAACDLQPGMKLSRNVYNANSILLLPEGHIFSSDSLRRLTKFLSEDNSPAEIFVFS